MRWQFTVKRAFDLVGSAAGLILLAPALLLIAAVIRVTMGSPVLFRQVRPGYKGRPFTIIKFRTMPIQQELCIPEADRLPFVGRLLRKTSLDELPELYNVL